MTTLWWDTILWQDTGVALYTPTGGIVPQVALFVVVKKKKIYGSL